MVRSGRIDQRDRATKRRRTEAPSQHDGEEELFDTLLRLATAFLDEFDDDSGARIPLDQYLSFVAMPYVPIAERLRLLAIASERRVPWEVTDQIYAVATHEDPLDTVVLASRAITARRFGYSDQARRVELEAAQLGATLAPDQPEWEYRLGMYFYDIERNNETALTHFDRAIGLGATDGLTMLYRARALHDLGRWDEAIAAYNDVPLGDLDRPWMAWRIHFLIEERATCLYFAGRHHEAFNEFDRVLTRYETQPHLLPRTEHDSFLPLAADKFPQLAERVANLFRSL